MNKEKILAALAARAPQSDFGQLSDFRRMTGRGNVRRALHPNLKDENVKPPFQETAGGRASRPRPDSGSMSEIAAFAMLDMPTNQFDMLMTALNIDAEAQERVHAKLVRVAVRSIQSDGFWPKQLRRKPTECGRSANPDYVSDLVQLAIFEFQAPAAFNAHYKRAGWFGLPERTWYRQMTKPYGVVWDAANATWHAGLSYIDHRLRHYAQA